MRILTEQLVGLNTSMIRGHIAALDTYRATLFGARQDRSYATPETALFAPADRQGIEDVLAVTEPLRTQVRTVFLVGIGGSDLGTRAVYDALHGYLDGYTRAHAPRLLSCATVEPRVLQHIRDIIASTHDPREIVMVVISKSGSTAETIANANMLYDLLRERFGPDAARAQTVVVSDEKVPFADRITHAGIAHRTFPHAIGGRYSVFTTVGLVPLALLGVDIRAFCEGGEAGARAATPEQGASGSALLAAFLYEAYLSEYRIHEHFMWHPELETLGKWYRQLLAESIGKERYDGTRVGMTPTVALGSIDLHSLGQLVFGGPKSRVTTFVATPSVWQDTPTLHDESVFMSDTLKGKRAGDVMQAIYGGVTATYAKHNLPFVRIELDAMTERELGVFMATEMASVMYLAHLLDVNAFDQPDVEEYKNETRRLLTIKD